MSILEFEHVYKAYNAQETALNDVCFGVKKGEFLALAGPSGSGKTTILNLACGLDLPTQGKISFLGKPIQKLARKQLTRLRKRYTGFVFQSYNLFPVLSVIENVEYPLALRNVSKRRRLQHAMRALEEVGLEDFRHRFPHQLSGGQQQRVAIARAIVSQPKIVFADEPTANLDSKTGGRLLELFKTLNHQQGITFIFSSHDPSVLQLADRVLHVHDGSITDED